jgi:hypothetical protein
MSHSMSSSTSTTTEAPSECFLVTADNLVQAVLRRYRGNIDEMLDARESEKSKAVPAVA